MKNDNFEQSHSAEKSERGTTLWDFQTSTMFQNIKKLKGDPLVQSKNFRKKISVPKKIQVKTPR